jgi:hypothetical protein
MLFPWIATDASRPRDDGREGFFSRLLVSASSRFGGFPGGIPVRATTKSIIDLKKIIFFSPLTAQSGF